MPKVFFFDIDGTLVDSPNKIIIPSEKTIEAINQLKAKGHYVLIATGRIFDMIEEPIRAIGFDGYITCNGSYCEFRQQTVIDLPADRNLLQRFIDDCRRYKADFALESLTHQYAYCFSDNGYFQQYLQHYHLNEELVIYSEQLCEAPIYKLNICGSDYPDGIEKLIELYQNDFDIMQQGTSYYYDVNQKSITKGSAVAAVLKYLDGHIDGSYAFGDGDNDKEMFEVVEIGIMMGHAHPNLAPFAKMETATVKDEGIYSALKDLEFID